MNITTFGVKTDSRPENSNFPRVTVLFPQKQNGSINPNLFCWSTLSKKANVWLATQFLWIFNSHVVNSNFHRLFLWHKLLFVSCNIDDGFIKASLRQTGSQSQLFNSNLSDIGILANELESDSTENIKEPSEMWTALFYCVNSAPSGHVNSGNRLGSFS